MNGLFIEIGTEEIPAGYIAPALRQLAQKIDRMFIDNALDASPCKTYGTPRRLALHVSSLASRQPDRQEEILGPPKKAAFDATGVPTRAAEGFARNHGVQVGDLQLVSTAKGEYIVLRRDCSGTETSAILQRLLPDLLLSLSFPKSMRWGTGTIVFARPIQWLVALLHGAVLPLHLGGIGSGAESRGHRFLAADAFPITGAESYLEDLRQRHVLADVTERRRVVLEEVQRAALRVAGVKARVLEDPELVDLVTNLVEEPHAVCGSFEERFLRLPAPVLICAMREHQKYFAVVDASDQLLPWFIAVNNTRTADEGLAVAGHQRVLRARLSDALFFYEEDRKTKLADCVAGLDGILFQQKLGSMAQKTERITELAVWLAGQFAPEMVEDVRRAASLAKADLLSAMVGEFPTLQGIMGMEYARADGEKEAVAQAIRDHYLPLRAGGELPESMPGALVGLADRMDSLIGCFGINEVPTGNTDPFGLRRQTLAMLHILAARNLSLSLHAFAVKASGLYGDRLPAGEQGMQAALEFIRARFVNDQQGKGVAVETVEAAVSVAFDEVPDTLARIRALDRLVSRTEFAVLAGSCKRIRNILKNCQAGGEPDVSLYCLQAEENLAAVFQKVCGQVRVPLMNKDYDRALEFMLELKAPLDQFFDQVLVMDPDERIRFNRINLLSLISSLFLRIGDLSRMQSLVQG